jgi:hypothetical protein
MAEPTNAFFTVQSMMTLGGATGATFVVSNGIQRAFDYNPRWLALAIAQIICLGVVHQSGGVGSDYAIGVINGFLVYCSAAGATGAAGAVTGAGTPPDASARRGNVALETRAAGARLETIAPTPPKRAFLSPWF